MSKKRETVKYELKKGKKVVYVGTTNNPDRREKEHKKDKNFTHMNIVGNKTTDEGAKKWEQDRLKTYRKNHGGDNPQYNDTDHG